MVVYTRYLELVVGSRNYIASVIQKEAEEVKKRAQNMTQLIISIPNFSLKNSPPCQSLLQKQQPYHLEMLTSQLTPA